MDSTKIKYQIDSLSRLSNVQNSNFGFKEIWMLLNIVILFLLCFFAYKIVKFLYYYFIKRNSKRVVY
jgi:hypothetical protein